MTLSPKIMQWEHILEEAEQLARDIRSLATARTDIVMNANAARVTGGGAMGTLVTEVSLGSLQKFSPSKRVYGYLV